MATYSIHGFPGPTTSRSSAWGVNLKGQVVGDAALDPEHHITCVSWQAGEIGFWLDALQATSASSLGGVNDSGVAAGVLDEGSSTQRAVWMRAGQMHDFSGVVGGVGSLASGINNEGWICGFNLNNDKSFVYDFQTQQLIRWIDPPPGYAARAAAINTAGHVVGIHVVTPVAADNLSARAFFSPSTAGALKVLEGFLATDLNDSDLVCGSLGEWSSSTIEPALWDATQAQPAVTKLPLPPEFPTGYAAALNNHADVVGAGYPKSGDRSALLFQFDPESKHWDSWDLNTLISDSSWQLFEATGITDNRWIIGNGLHQGQWRAFLLEPQPVKPPPPPPVLPIDIQLPISFDIPIGNLLVGGSGWIVSLKGDHRPRPAPGPEPRLQFSAATRDALLGLVLDALARSIPEGATREQVRRELLEGVRAHVDQLLRSVAASPTPGGGAVARADLAPELRARLEDRLARRFGLRARR
jgi:uncharacterized membrane protein